MADRSKAELAEFNKYQFNYKTQLLMNTVYLIIGGNLPWWLVFKGGLGTILGMISVFVG